MNRKCLWLILPLLMASVLVAQGIPTGTILGRAINEGLGLPGVTVVAKSPALQGSRTAVTSANGDFAFVNLPPGDYTLTFTMSGFQTVTRAVKVSASQQAVVNAQMSISAVAAEIAVVAQSETISQTAAQATTYTADVLSKLPTGRTLTSAVLLSPGVSERGANGASIAGGQSTENLYTVNGVAIGDNIRSQSLNLFIEDAIQETTTTTSSVSAEYGRFTGGVINAITKSGGNSFSGSFRTTFTNDSWRAYSDYRTAAGVNPQAGTFLDKTIPTYEATLGGPIVKDRVWFFGAGRYFDTVGNLSTTTRLTNIAYTYGDEELRYEAKLTVSPFQNHTVTGSYINNAREQVNYWFPSIPIADLASIYTRQTPQELLAVNYNGVITDTLFVDAQYSSRKFTFENSGGRFTDFVKGTVLRDLARGIAYNAPIFCGVCTPERRDSDNWVIKATYFLSTKSLGSHNIVVGYDDYGGQREANNFQSASNYQLYTRVASVIEGDQAYPVVTNAAYVGWWPVLQASLGSDLRTKSAFVNDTWRLNSRFSFNVGLRYDKNDATSQGGQVTSDDSAFSPRLAATWDVTGNGRLRVTASYSKYVSALAETQAGSSGSAAGSPASFFWYYDGAPINTAGPYLTSNQVMERVEAWMASKGCQPDPLAAGCSLVPFSSNIGGVNVQIRESLKSPSADEYVIGFAGSLGNRGSYRVDAVRREFTDWYDLKRDLTTGSVQNPISGAMLDLGLIVNSSAYRREYTGLHSQFAYRIGESLNLGGNWTWSHLIGDIVGETSGSSQVQGGDQNQPEYFQKSWNNPVADLSSDQRHRVRFFGTWDTPLPKSLGSLSLNLVQNWDTGLPYGAIGAVASSRYVTNPGYRVPPSSVTYNYTAPDAFRTEDVWRTDLSLYYGFRIADAVEIFLSPQLYNVFNNQAIQSVNTTVETAVANGTANYAHFNPFTTTPVQGARGTGANWNYGPDFGKPTSPASYQTPRYFQFSVGVRF